MNKRQIKRRAKKLASLPADEIQSRAEMMLYESYELTLNKCCTILQLVKGDKETLKTLYDLFRVSAAHPDMLDKVIDRLCDNVAEDVKEILKRLEAPKELDSVM